MVSADFLTESLYPENADPSLKRRLDFFTRYLKLGKALDVGCGSGWISRAISRNGFDAFSIDVDEASIKSAKLAMRMANTNHELIIGSVTHLPIRNDVFNSIICSEVLEHILRIRHALSEIHRVLTRDGVVAISIPGLSYRLVDVLGRFFTSRHSRWVSQQLIDLGLTTSNKLKTKGHVQNFTPMSIRNLLKAFGFSVICFQNAFFFSHIVSAFFLGLFGKKHKFVKKIKELDLKVCNVMPSILCGGYLIISIKTKDKSP